MNDEHIRNIALDVFRQQQQGGQYNTSPTPTHSHNGIDSQRLPLSSISNGMIFGMGTMSGGVLDVTNPAINAGSICVATKANVSSAPGSFSQLAVGFVAPSTMRIFLSGGSGAGDIYYIIICKQ